MVHEAGYGEEDREYEVVPDVVLKDSVKKPAEERNVTIKKETSECQIFDNRGLQHKISFNCILFYDCYIIT